MRVFSRRQYHPSPAGGARWSLPRAPMDHTLSLHPSEEAQLHNSFASLWRGLAKETRRKEEQFLFLFLPSTHQDTQCYHFTSHTENQNSKWLPTAFLKINDVEGNANMRNMKLKCGVWEEEKSFEHNVGWGCAFVFDLAGGGVFYLSGRADFQNDL